MLMVALLSRQISRKLAEMELSLRLRRQGNEDAWKFIPHTDMGRENMDEIRKHAHALIRRATVKIQIGQAQIVQSLMLSRIGIAVVTAIGLLAFFMYLRQANALQVVNQREQACLNTSATAWKAWCASARRPCRAGKPLAASAGRRARPPGPRAATNWVHCSPPPSWMWRV